MKRLFENIKKKYRIYAMILLGPAAATITTTVLLIHHHRNNKTDIPSWGPPPLPPKSHSIFNNIDNVDFDQTIDLYSWYVNGGTLVFKHKRFEAFFIKTVLYKLNVEGGDLRFYFNFPQSNEVDIKIMYDHDSDHETIYKKYTIKYNSI